MRRLGLIMLGVATGLLCVLGSACASSPPEATTLERDADTDAALILERDADRPPRVTPNRVPRSR